ncbi:hypothetical protein G5I_13522 [Acromyrmex echinatior]|uniref:Uncharacterized protein n=1 Tax=Acromyrmex echinatior TaxID=103372 RepID=F4X595_ACREC|nr:hypothetical protein G5I_13522 [Acromyrmex echinatior]
MLGALGSLIGGAASVAKAGNDSKTARRQLEELQRHDRAMEQGRGLYLALYKYGRGLTCASWLTAYHHCDGRTGWYNETKRLIIAAVFEDDTIVYVKGKPNEKREKRTWLWNLLLDDERERMCIETLDVLRRLGIFNQAGCC